MFFDQIKFKWQNKYIKIAANILQPVAGHKT